MVFFFWTRPSPQEQQACITKSGSFNYDTKYRGATTKTSSALKEDMELSKDGFHINHARVLLGSGSETFEKGKVALQNWRHLGLDWLFVNSNTPIRTGQKFCICAKILVPWFVLPLETLNVTDVRNSKKGIATFQFSGGAVKGHLLAGEERFSVELDEKNQVWYEVVSFSKPAHFLSVVGNPYLRFLQKQFYDQSAKSVVKYVSSS